MYKSKILAFVLLLVIILLCNNLSAGDNSNYIETSTFSSISSYYETERILENIIKAIKENKPDIDKTKNINFLLTETSYKISSLLNNYEVKNETMTYKEAIILIRQAIQSFFQKNNRNPKSLEELVPNYLISIPSIKIHEIFNNRVKYIRNTSFDRNYLSAIDNNSEYLYFSDPQSTYYGFILINSDKNSEEGIAYCQY